jgi:hypothetical protein
LGAARRLWHDHPQARIGMEAFYQKHGYAIEGEPFDENTIRISRMTKSGP